jgi:single-strand DNA-binding protein
MTIIGRITKDAQVNTTREGKAVVNFSVAVNDSYKPKNRERVKQTTYYNCSYWITPKVAANLKKGTLVEVAGRITVTAYPCSDGVAKASLNCHVSSIKIHAWPKEVTLIGKAASTSDKDRDEVPF